MKPVFSSKLVDQGENFFPIRHKFVNKKRPGVDLVYHHIVTFLGKNFFVMLFGFQVD